MNFKDLNIKNEYRNLSTDIINEFYVPILSCSKIYRRAVGFFSATSVMEISKGLTSIAKNNGYIQIVASPELTTEDILAINNGYKMREKIIETSLYRTMDELDKGDFSEEYLNILANLIAKNILDFKIAVTENDNNIGMYHEKMGIMEDNDGNVIAFSGSMNETRTAMKLNYESIDVFNNWTNNSETSRVDSKREAFINIWNNFDKNVSSYNFPDFKEKFVEKFKQFDINFNIDKSEVTFKESPTPLYIPSIPKYPSLPQEIVLNDYQIEAINNWKSAGYKGIFDMATGTGKTFTGLGALVELSKAVSNNLAVIIICPYQHLVDQWVEDIIRFNIDPVIGYSSSPQKDWKRRLENSIRKQKYSKNKNFFCFISTNATFKSDFVQGQLKKIKSEILIIVDEAHNFGAKSFFPYLDNKYKYRLALSATLERHNDEEGTQFLKNFFGEKNIEYSLERAIAEEKLTPYKYYPILVYLTEDELLEYDKISFEMSKHLISSKNGKLKLDSYGELLAIKRSRVIAGAQNKLSELRKAITPYKDKSHLLVYCGATNVIDESKDITETDIKDIRQIEAVIKILGNELGMYASKFTSDESSQERKSIKDSFSSGEDLQCIVAIKCLDEGVNIPEIRTAFILASTTNPKEYIQRRGRVLRKSFGKKVSEIFDFVTLPCPLDEIHHLTKEQTQRHYSLIKNEVKRMIEFQKLSKNRIASEHLVWDIMEKYDLSLEEIMGENEFEL